MKKEKTLKKKARKIPLFRLMGVLTLATVAVTATFAKYVSNNSTTAGSYVSPFATTVTVDRSSSLFVFDNADYTFNGAVMNSPQNTPFTVSNSEERDGNTVITGVDLRYTLVFYVPITFAASAAIQVVDKDANNAITPLYLLSEFNGTDFTTDSDRFGGLPTTEESYQYENGEYRSGENSVRVERVKTESVYHYSFGTSYVTETSKLQLPMISMQVKDDGRVENYYKISVSRKQFTLTGDVKTEHEYALRLVPSTAMTAPANGTAVDDAFSVNWEECLQNGLANADSVSVTAKNWSLALEDGVLTMTDNSDAENPKVYEDVMVGVRTDENIGHGNSTGKSYPCRINAYFEQVSD